MSSRFSYHDGRNTAPHRLAARDHGMVFACGQGPDDCDYLGAREAWVFEHEGLNYMTYRGAGRDACVACLATSQDLLHWERHGPILPCVRCGSRRY